ncbi:MAG: class I SAM-dependent methyltransferase [Thermoprotei archaeon]
MSVLGPMFLMLTRGHRHSNKGSLTSMLIVSKSSYNTNHHPIFSLLNTLPHRDILQDLSVPLCSIRLSNQGIKHGSFESEYDNMEYEKCWARKAIEDASEKRVLQELLPTSSRMCLELGGGYGRITSILEKMFDKVYMVDKSRKHVSEASKNLRNVNIVMADLNNLPFNENVFDCIIMIRVAHHIPDPPSLMQEIVRISKDGATVVLSVPNPTLNRLIHLSQMPRDPHQGPYLNPPSSYMIPSMQLEAIRGTGLFDNFVGQFLNKFQNLSSLDVATSKLWPLKSDIFLKLKVLKHGH